jgi:hypothetical protein
MCTFDLWMSKRVHDVFIIIVNFLFSKSEDKHVTIELFEMNDTNGATMILKLQQHINKLSFIHKIFAYIKDEGSNL